MQNVDGKIVIGTEIDTKKFDKQIDYLDKKANKIEQELKEPKKYNVDTTEAEAKLEKIKNKIQNLNDKSVKEGLKSLENIQFSPKSISNLSNFKVQNEGLTNSIKKLNGELPYTAKNMKDLKIQSENVEKQQKKTNNELSKGFEKGTKSLKRFALSLFGVGSALGVVSKASSSYLSQNEELANKLQSVWVGLGSFLEPVINNISDILLKGLGYLNEFIKALTGVDYIAKANAKALEKQAKSQNKLNKATQDYDFDVTRKQQEKSTSNELPSGYITIPELDNNIISKLQDLAKWLKENEDWIKKVGIALGVTFGAVEIGKILGNIATLIGAGGAGGLEALAIALLALTAVFTVTLAVQGAVEVKKQIDELNEALDKNIQMQQSLIEQQDGVSKKFWDLYYAGKASKEQIDGYTWSIKDNNDSLLTQIQNLEDQKTWLGEITGSNKKLSEQQKILNDRLALNNYEYEKLYEQGILNEQQVEEYKEGLKKQIEVMDKLGEDTTNLKKKYEDLTKNPYKIEIGAEDKTESIFTKIKNKFSSLFGGSGASGGGGGGSRGGQAYALGGIVTQPTRALIGEAGYNEYVLPEREDYLSRLAGLISQYSGNSGSTTNIYLDGRLIQRQIQNVKNNKDFATNN